MNARSVRYSVGVVRRVILLSFVLTVYVSCRCESDVPAYRSCGPDAQGGVTDTCVAGTGDCGDVSSTAELALTDLVTLEDGGETEAQGDGLVSEGEALAGDGVDDVGADEATDEAIHDSIDDEAAQHEVPEGYVIVPAGDFLMGSPEHEAGRGDDEPLHLVHISKPFLMKEHEVTQAEWREALEDDHIPSKLDQCGDDCPVEGLNWWSAVAFCNALSDQEGLAPCYTMSGCKKVVGHGLECEQVVFQGLDCHGYRLPTEAEWEYAARAGTVTSLYSGDLPITQVENDAPAADPIAWYAGNSGADYPGAVNCSEWPDTQYVSETCGVHPVSGKIPNPWGLWDMSGNVWEWCWDWYGDYEGPETDPLGPGDGTLRVLRGGSWRVAGVLVRSANRGRYEPGVRADHVGLRPVRSLP